MTTPLHEGPITVGQLMTADVVTLGEDETLDLADDIMRLGRIRHLPVVRGATLAGLVTHRDILRAKVSTLAGLEHGDVSAIHRRIRVADIMRREVETTRPDAHALRAARTMRRHKYGCLPVVDRDGHLVGIITEADFLDLAIRVLEDFDVPRASAPSA